MNLPFIRLNPLGLLVLGAIAVYLVYLYAGGGREVHQISKLEVISLKHLLSVCVSAAEAGGVKVREVRESSNLKEKSKGKTKEGANDPVTYGDMLSHRTMLYTLKKSFPHIKVVSEEDGNEMEPHDVGPPVSSWVQVDDFPNDEFIDSKDILVWIDPLDATQEYTENLLDYVTTLVCVAIKGRPVLGVIHLPFQSTTVWGWVGKGTSNPSLFSELRRPDPGKPPSIVVSRSHAGQVKEMARAAFGPEAEVISAGGAGFKSLQVAEGKADAYIHVSLIKKWDICSGHALLLAVGGNMTALDGTPIHYGNPDQPKNEKGLVAAVFGHELFVERLSR